MIRVVLLEPDYWHRRGVAAAIATSEEIELLDESSETADVVLISHARVEEAGTAEISVNAARYSAAVLVYGDSADAETAADMFVAGAYGYYSTAQEPTLAEAIMVVASGHAWGPRATLTLLAERSRDLRRDEIPGIDAEIFELLHEGLTNKEIGQRIGLAESTVKARMNRLYRQFGVTTRLQLLTAAIRKGLVKVGRAKNAR